MLPITIRSLKLMATISLTLLSAPAIASQEITFRCEGFQKHFFDYADPALTGVDYEKFMNWGFLKELDTASILRGPPYSLKANKDWVEGSDTRVYQILPGEYIRGPNFEFSFDMCRVYDLAGRLELICTDDKDQEGLAVKGSLLIFQPPFRLQTKQTHASGFWKKNDKGNWLVANYNYDEFLSGNCELMDAVPSVDEWIQ